MIYEVDKYRAEILKIAGFAMMTPFGRIIVQPMVVFNEFNSPIFVLYLIIALWLFYMGLLSVARGYSILKQEKEKLICKK